MLIRMTMTMMMMPQMMHTWLCDFLVGFHGCWLKKPSIGSNDIRLGNHSNVQAGDTVIRRDKTVLIVIKLHDTRLALALICCDAYPLLDPPPPPRPAAKLWDGTWSC